MATEEPKFTLVLQQGELELRDYPSHVVAEVTVIGTQQQASSLGLSKLAAYVFGANEDARQISMTTPVTKCRTSRTIAMTAHQIGAPGEWVVRFIMPAALALCDLPRPNDPAVTLRAMPAARFAVMRFSGLGGEESVAAETAKLLTFAKAHHLELLGPATQARYNPSWTPWFLRRNEVMLPVGVVA